MQEAEARIRNDFMDIRKELNTAMKALDDRTSDFPEQVQNIYANMKQNNISIQGHF